MILFLPRVFQEFNVHNDTIMEASKSTNDETDPTAVKLLTPDYVVVGLLLFAYFPCYMNFVVLET